MDYTHVVHPFEPVFDGESRVLVLGSLPSVKSRAAMFYYGHPQNRFWRVLAAVFDEPAFAPPVTAETIPVKRELLLRHRVALWDVVHECDIALSSDSSIKNAVPNDIERILRAGNVTTIAANGKTAFNLYQKFFGGRLEAGFGVTARCLPSTSPANAAWTLDRLVAEWRAVAECGAGGVTDNGTRAKLGSNHRLRRGVAGGG